MNEIQAEIPVAAVTLFEDRARVKRSGTVDLPSGASVLEIPGVSPLISDRSLSAVLSGAAEATVSGVSVSRAMKRPELADTADIESRLEEMNDRWEELSDRIRVIDARRTDLAGIAGLTAREFPDDIAAGRPWSEGREAEAASIDEGMSGLAIDRFGIAAEMEDLEEEREDLRSLLESRQTPSNRCEASVRLDIDSPEPVRCVITIEYAVPAACWRPGYRAEQIDDDLEFRSIGWVWQNTGEDWRDVDLAFSTKRPSLGNRPPMLSDDEITSVRKAKEDVVEIRDEAIDEAGLGGGGAADSSSVLPGVDDGGIPRTFRAGSPADIPSDGRPRRFELGSFRTGVQTDLIAMPEMSPYAFIRTVQSNGGAMPLLAGPVDLIRNGTHLGRTRAVYVSPGERFALGWGPDPGLRIHRSVSTGHRDPGMLNSRDRTVYETELKISNIADDERILVVRERIPVSEIEKVKVSFDAEQTSDGFSGPDADGMVEWTITLPAREKSVLRLVYAMEKHRSVQGL